MSKVALFALLVAGMASAAVAPFYPVNDFEAIVVGRTKRRVWATLGK